MGDFVYFTAARLERNSKGKKEVKPFFPCWKNDDKSHYTKEQYKEICDPNDKVIIIPTGEYNNVTVFDFDKEGTYDECIKNHPELKEAYTVKTNKGYHIYCAYNKNYKTTTNNKRGIDIRNDDALVFGNGTITEFGTNYVLLNNEKRLDIQMSKSFYETIVPPPKPKTKPASCIKSETGRRLKVIEIIKPEIIDEMENFRRIVWAMKNEGFSIDDVKKVAMKSQHYDEETWDCWFASTKLWESSNKNNKNCCKFGTLIHYAKMSDEKAFYDLFITEKSNHEIDTSDIGLAKLYLDILGDNIFYQKQTIYIYLVNEWWCDTEGHFVKKNFFEEMSKYFNKLTDEINRQINEIEGEESKDSDIKELLKRIDEIRIAQKHIYKVHVLNNVLSAIKTLIATLKDDIIFDTNEEQKYNINFKNGVYELNTGVFRPRTKDDFVSKYLNWEYNPESVTDKARKELWDSIHKIEPDDDKKTMLLSYFAYCLTGDCSKQMYICLVGYSAANGKSHLFKMMSKCFSIYTQQLSSDTFCKGNAKAHKELIYFNKYPVRFAYMEEMDKDKPQDAELIKKIVDGDQIPVEVMYGTKEDVDIQAKIITSSNGDPNIRMDKGVLRRMQIMYLNSQFVDDIDADDWENRRFVVKYGMEKMFEDDVMKNAVFELLTRSEYKNFKVCASVKAETAETADTLNTFKHTFEENYEITGLEDDVINKNDFLRVMNLKAIDLKKTISDLKIMGITYNKARRKGVGRGVFIGLKEVGEGECQVAP
tara:strand:+ start:68 stop:2353 length:2286 start_codon:yes stop_codon:yes gene_type:complete